MQKQIPNSVPTTIRTASNRSTESAINCNRLNYHCRASNHRLPRLNINTYTSRWFNIPLHYLLKGTNFKWGGYNILRQPKNRVLFIRRNNPYNLADNTALQS